MSECLIGIANVLIAALGAVLSVVISVLPNSPFGTAQYWLSQVNVTWLKYLNWIIPVSSMVAIMEVWVGAMLIYYCYMIVLKWIKAVG